MSAARDRALPADVMETAKQHILDTLGAMVSGSELAPGRAAIKFARAYGGQKVATVAGSTVLCGPIEAALANGVMAHADETDDYWSQNGWHPGANVVPAALATGEQFGITGTEFLRAVVLGYDVGARVITTLQPPLIEPHSMVGTFAAAAAAGSAASHRATDALAARLRRAAGVRLPGVGARQRSHREGLRVRRDAGAQRRDVSRAGSFRLERHRRRPVGRRQFHSDVRAEGGSGRARRPAWRATT